MLDTVWSWWRESVLNAHFSEVRAFAQKCARLHKSALVVRSAFRGTIGDATSLFPFRWSFLKNRAFSWILLHQNIYVRLTRKYHERWKEQKRMLDGRSRKQLETTTAWPNALLLCAKRVRFSANATKGWAWFMMQPYCRTGGGYWALRNLLLVETGCLEFQNGTAGVDVLNKHVEQFFFRQCVTFCEHGQLKELLLKAQSRQPLFDLQQSDSTTESTIIRNKSWRPQLRDRQLKGWQPRFKTNCC